MAATKIIQTGPVAGLKSIQEERLALQPVVFRELAKKRAAGLTPSPTVLDTQFSGDIKAQIITAGAITGTQLKIENDIVFQSSARALFQNPANTLIGQVGFILNEFVVAGPTGGNGVSIYGPNVTLCETTGNFGGGSKVVFVANATVEPTFNPVNGGLFYVYGGAFKYRGSSGTLTVLALA